MLLAAARNVGANEQIKEPAQKTAIEIQRPNHFPRFPTKGDERAERSRFAK